MAEDIRDHETDELRRFHQLFKDGIITEAEFNKKKEEIMSGEYSKKATLKVNPGNNTFKSVLENKRIIYPLVLIIICLAGYFVWTNTLFGNDKAAYDLLVKGAKHFNYPSTVRIESGTVVDDSMFANISAENGFGQRKTGCYWIGNDGYVLESTSSACLGSNYQKPLNAKKINKKLKEKYKNE